MQAQQTKILPALFVLAYLGLSAIGCTDKKKMSELPLAEQGKLAYATHCTACHSPNPKLDGAIGPSVHGASLELLEHRILKSTYPAGYKPKKETGVMPALPFLKDSIPALHAYLNTP
jgi:mono/diheme cytochrome c family protein